MAAPRDLRLQAQLDVTWCDSLPLRSPGSIQPFGLLLVMDRSRLTILQASANAAELLNVPLDRLLTMTFDDLLPEGAGRVIGEALRKIDGRAFIPLRLGEGAALRDFDGTVHGQGERLLLELEPADRTVLQPTSSRFQLETTSLLERLQQATDLAGLLHGTAEEVRKLTGYDRVMIYQFAPDLHGQVVAEALAPSAESYLGLHFPASDIPRPARELYQQSWLRLIRDVAEAPVPMVPPDVPPSDLGLCVLRSIAPIHLEYLKNMGVRASLSISLLSGKRLWGLIACHHSMPCLIPFADRLALEVLGARLSAEIALHEQRSKTAQMVASQALHHELANEALRRGGTEAALRSRLADLARHFRADGVAMASPSEVTATGNVPSRPAILRLVKWLAGRDIRNCWATDALAEHWEDAPQLAPDAAGMIALRHERQRDAFLLIFRPEVVRTVTWAGNPNHPLEDGEEGLGPRHSFRAWKETVKGRAEPWSDADLRVAGDLLVALRKLFRQEKRRTLSPPREDVEAMRRKLLNIISHELRTPLTAIEGYSEFLADALAGYPSPEPRQYLSEIRIGVRRLESTIGRMFDAARLEAGLLALKRDACDVRDLVQRSVANAEASAAAKSIHLDFPAADPMPCMLDAERIEDALEQLLDNALKFTPPGGRIGLHLERHGGEVRFQVTDSGPGIAPDLLPHVFEKFYQADIETTRAFGGLGLGLFIAKQIITAHGGEIGAVSEPGRGSTFWFTLPC